MKLVIYGQVQLCSVVWTVSVGGRYTRRFRKTPDKCLLQLSAVIRCPLCPMPCLRLPPVVVRKKLLCALSTIPVHCRNVIYLKIYEMCQNTAQSMLNFFLFPVANGQSTCSSFSSIESPITTIFFCPLCPPPCPLTQKSWCRPWSLGAPLQPPPMSNYRICLQSSATDAASCHGLQRQSTATVLKLL